MQKILLKHFNADRLNQAWKHRNDIRFKFNYSHDEPMTFHVENEEILVTLQESRDANRPHEIPIYLGILGVTGAMLKQGPVVIRPEVDMCNMMANTEIKLGIRDYRQKFPVICVEFPEGNIEVNDESASVKPSFMMLWNPIPGWLMTFHSFDRDRMVVVRSKIIDISTNESIEDILRIYEESNAKTNHLAFFGALRKYQRIAINLALLMTHRPSDLTPLPPKVAKNRRGNDDRLRQLAAREVQTVIFRDLVIKPKPKYIECQETGMKLKPHMRGGHWKNQACGPKWKDHKTLWVQPYWTGQRDREEAGDGMGGGVDDVIRPTIIYH